MSAGALVAPNALMLSDSDPADQLQQFDTSVNVDLQGAGHF